MAKKKMNRYCVTTTNGTFYCEGITVKYFKDDNTGETFLAVVDKIYENGEFHSSIIFNMQHLVCWEDVSEEE